MTTGKFYGILDREPGFVTMFIDYDKDLDGRLLRHAYTINIYAFEEYLRTVVVLPEYDIDDIMANLYKDYEAEEIGNYLLLSRHEWVALDDDNNIIQPPYTRLMSYINQ